MIEINKHREFFEYLAKAGEMHRAAFPHCPSTEFYLCPSCNWLHCYHCQTRLIEVRAVVARNARLAIAKGYVFSVEVSSSRETVHAFGLPK